MQKIDAHLTRVLELKQEAIAAEILTSKKEIDRMRSSLVFEAGTAATVLRNTIALLVNESMTDLKMYIGGLHTPSPTKAPTLLSSTAAPTLVETSLPQSRSISDASVARAPNQDWRRDRVITEKALDVKEVTGVAVSLSFVNFTLAPGSERIVNWCTTASGEQYVTRVFRHVLEHDETEADNNHDIVLDIGANCGFYGIMSAVLGWRTFLFDPQPTCQTRIAYAIERNNMSSWALLVPHAVSFPLFDMQVSSKTNCSGRFPISAQEKVAGYSGGWSTSTTTAPAGYVRDRAVDVASMLGAGEYVRLVKIDAEGNELNVLRSLAPLIVEKRIGNIVVEVTPAFWQRAGVRNDDVVEMLCLLVHSGYVGITLATEKPPLTVLESCEHVRELLPLRRVFTQVDVWFQFDGSASEMCNAIGEHCHSKRNERLNFSNPKH